MKSLNEIREFDEKEARKHFESELPKNSEETGRQLLIHLQLIGARWQFNRMQAESEGLRTQLAKLTDALENANELTSSVLEDLEHYFDNKCCPTADEVNQAAIADSQIRLALAELSKARGET